jgi:hypothetical protein
MRNQAAPGGRLCPDAPAVPTRAGMHQILSVPSRHSRETFVPTNINIQNGTNTSLSLQTGVTASLDGKYWSIESDTAAANAKTAVLWMDRDIGITNGDTWIFTTSFQFDGVAVQLMESLTGTLLSSNIKIRILAGTRDSGWTDESTSVQISGSDGANYQLDGTFFLNGVFDDVTYSLIAV